MTVTVTSAMIALDTYDSTGHRSGVASRTDQDIISQSDRRMQHGMQHE